MRKLFVALLASLFLVGGSASMIAAQSEATPAAGADVETDGSNPVDPAIGDVVTYYGQNGDPAASISITEVERNWEDYDEYSEPDTGVEYIAFTIEIESLTSRGAIDVSNYDFSLQTAAGYLSGNSYVSSEDAEPPLLEDDTSLAGGETLEFVIVFEAFQDEELGHLFWQPDSGVLLTVAQLEGE
jgi:hypothetical protein